MKMPCKRQCSATTDRTGLLDGFIRPPARDEEAWLG
jgi:hypothetical protein